jgi:hypothetical protein
VGNYFYFSNNYYNFIGLITQIDQFGGHHFDLIWGKWHQDHRFWTNTPMYNGSIIGTLEELKGKIL